MSRFGQMSASKHVMKMGVSATPPPLVACILQLLHCQSAGLLRISAWRHLKPKSTHLLLGVTPPRLFSNPCHEDPWSFYMNLMLLPLLAGAWTKLAQLVVDHQMDQMMAWENSHGTQKHAASFATAIRRSFSCACHTMWGTTRSKLWKNDRFLREYCACHRKWYNTLRAVTPCHFLHLEEDSVVGYNTLRAVEKQPFWPIPAFLK